MSLLGTVLVLYSKLTSYDWFIMLMLQSFLICVFRLLHDNGEVRGFLPGGSAGRRRDAARLGREPVCVGRPARVRRGAEAGAALGAALLAVLSSRAAGPAARTQSAAARTREFRLHALLPRLDPVGLLSRILVSGAGPVPEPRPTSQHLA